MSLPITAAAAAVVPLRLQLNKHPLLFVWFHRATGCLLLQVSTYLSSRIDCSSVFVSLPAKPEFLWVTQCFLPLHVQLFMPNQFRTQLQTLANVSTCFPPKRRLTRVSAPESQWSPTLLYRLKVDTLANRLCHKGGPLPSFRGYITILQKSFFFSTIILRYQDTNTLRKLNIKGFWKKSSCMFFLRVEKH